MNARLLKAKPGRRKPTRARFHEWLDRGFPLWALTPTLLVLLGLTVYPLIQLAIMSVSTIQFAEGKVIWRYTGLDNFYTFLADPIFLTSVRNTLAFVVVTVTVEMVMGLTLALLVSQITRWTSLLRAVLMIPILVPAIAIGTAWRLMYNYEFGIFNRLLVFLHLPAQNWTGSEALALPSIMVVDIWHWTAFVFLLMLAGIQSLPIEPVEAARVDGASGREILQHITLPLLRPTILVTLMFRTIAAFKVFDEVYLLTGGGPGSATEVISLYINRVFFSQLRMGYGALLSVLTIALIAFFVILYSHTTRKESTAA
jgi:multiple sugar transport system permease protein